MIRNRILLKTVCLLSNVSCTVADDAEPIMHLASYRPSIISFV